MGIWELMGVEEPAEEWLAEGLLPAGGNILLAAYPKSFKTMFLLELAVALTSATPFLGRFRVPARRRVGLVLMEDQAHQVRRRLMRLCAARGMAITELAEWLHLWFRPPLRLNDITIFELGNYAAELELDFLGVDSWSYVAGGDHNDAAQVTPQLQALSSIRAEREGITVHLNHHARKDRGDTADAGRLTDIIRNSSAFGAWYDAGVVLSRRDETSPVTVRVELRDHVTPEPFAFEVKDEHPATPHNGQRSSGWLRLRVSDHRPELVERRAAAEKLVPAVHEFLSSKPEGVSRTKLRNGVTGRNDDVEAAFDLLVEAGEAQHTPAESQGKGAVYRLISNPAQPCPNPAPGRVADHPAHPAHTPVGGGRGQGRHREGASRGGAGFECAAGCGRPVGRKGMACATCQAKAEGRA